MLKLTLDDLCRARSLAEHILALERDKDSLEAVSVTLSESRMRVGVPRETVRAAIDAALKQAHANLEAMGVVLMPSAPTEILPTKRVVLSGDSLSGAFVGISDQRYGMANHGGLGGFAAAATQGCAPRKG